MTPHDLTRLAFGLDALEEAVAVVARAAGIDGVGARRMIDVGAGEPSAMFDRVARAAGLEAEPVLLADLAAELGRAAPAIVATAGGYLVLLRSRRDEVVLLAPDGSEETWSTSAIAAALRPPADGRFEACLDAGGLPAARRARARLLLGGSAAGRSGACPAWLLRPDPGAIIRWPLRLARAARTFAPIGAAMVLQIGLTVASWTILGRATVTGRLEPGWLAGWVLAVATAVPLGAATTRFATRFAVGLAAQLKWRLMAGAVRIDPGEVRRLGSGRLFAIATEVEILETAGPASAMASVMVVVQLVAASAMLLAGAGGALHVSLLASWVVVVVVAALGFGRARQMWTDRRLDLSDLFVEHVAGHRTRAAQQSPDQWHVREDAELERYVVAARAVEKAQGRLSLLPQRGWLLVSLAGLAPALCLGTPSAAELVLSIAGILQAASALSALSSTLVTVLNALVAWSRVRSLHRAARLEEELETTVPAPGDDRLAGHAIVEAYDVTARHPGQAMPVLRGLRLAIRGGDRVLLLGDSGSGKSSLLALLAGHLRPESGALSLCGLDATALSADAMRELVAIVPQAHEDHVITGTLLFNLMLGCSWPPSEADRTRASELCRELRLGVLLERMPQGLDQIVGETGWQLSHGERSRVFLARALMRETRLVVLDETFATLDPETTEACLDAVRRRGAALVVAAHP